MTSTSDQESHEQKKQRLISTLQQRSTDQIRLSKDTSNLFRKRRPRTGQGLDVRSFNQVIEVAPDQGYVEVEGMTPYFKLAHECLKHNVMPAVVPELKSITIGGAITGIGIESSSFKYGLVHETVQEMDILLGDGTCHTCTPDNKHKDLFFGFPNSYGTLGYALKLKIKVVPVKPYVRLRHFLYQDASSYFTEMNRFCSRDIDFIDGTVFGPGEYYLTVGEFTESAPYTSDYSYENIYYRSIRERETDYLRIEDYLWRWDTDWFWCSQYFWAQNPLVRRLLGRERLNSVTYMKLMSLNRKYNLTSHLNRLLGIHSEAVIQDVEIPLENCRAFLDFYFSTIRFTPIWICPLRSYQKNVRFPLYPLKPEPLYVNFGFWNVIKSRRKTKPGFYNRLVEQKVSELGGMKSLYSDVYYSAEDFWKIYNHEEYSRLKNKYDPQGIFKDLYTKCAGNE